AAVEAQQALARIQAKLSRPFGRRIGKLVDRNLAVGADAGRGMVEEKDLRLAVGVGHDLVAGDNLLARNKLLDSAVRQDELSPRNHRPCDADAVAWGSRGGERCQEKTGGNREAVVDRHGKASEVQLRANEE